RTGSSQVTNTTRNPDRSGRYVERADRTGADGTAVAHFRHEADRGVVGAAIDTIAVEGEVDDVGRRHSFVGKIAREIEVTDTRGGPEINVIHIKVMELSTCVELPAEEATFFSTNSRLRIN